MINYTFSEMGDNEMKGATLDGVFMTIHNDQGGSRHVYVNPDGQMEVQVRNIENGHWETVLTLPPRF